MFNAAKNFMTSQAARLYVGKLIGRYAELQELKIDTQAKTVNFVCTPHGETEPVAVRIDRYELTPEGDRTFIRVLRCTCSKPWMQTLAEDFIMGRPVEVPPWAVAAL